MGEGLSGSGARLEGWWVALSGPGSPALGLSLWFLRRVYFLSLLPVTQGPEYRLCSPIHSRVLGFFDAPPGLLSLCICAWPGENGSDPSSFTASFYSGIWFNWLNLFHVISVF